MKTKMIGIVLLTLIMSACAKSDLENIVSSGSGVSISSQKLSPTDEKNVKLYYGNVDLPKKYKVIGHVSADHYSFAAIPHSETSIANELKKQAAKIGGTGVINIQPGLDRTTGDVIVR